MNKLDEWLSEHQKQFEFTMKVLDKCLLNPPKTIAIHYEGTWWVPLKTQKTIEIYCEDTGGVPLKHTENNSNLLWRYLISTS